MLRRDFLAILPVSAAALWAQNQTAPGGGQQGPAGEIEVEVNVVNVPVTVTDAEGRFITDLKREDFRVWEDGQPVEVRYFSADPKQAVVVGFLLDASNSARLYFKTYQEALTDLAWTFLPGDNQNRGFLAAYHTRVDFLVKPTRDGEAIVERIRKLKPGGGAALLDAVYEACTKYMRVLSQPREPKRVLIVIGDGHDNASKVSLEQALEAAQRAQVVIYAVSTVAYGMHNSEEANLIKLAEETGGRVERPLFKVHDKVAGYLSTPSDEGNYAYKVGTGQYASELAGKIYKAIMDITGDVTHQYILGYTPMTPFSNGKFREIKVEANLRNVAHQLRARRGYFPPLPVSQ
jgi:Ca-activated chloride channel family protein